MSERRYRLNKKSFEVLRAVGTGKWAYAHVSSQGIIATDTQMMLRVSLPEVLLPLPDDPEVFPEHLMKELAPKTSELIVMPAGYPAKTGEFNIPNFSAAFPDPAKQSACITVNAAKLIKILRAACAVTGHPLHTVRLRLYGDHTLRVDAYRNEGEQECTGLLMASIYNGVCIPGDKPTDAAPVTEIVGVSKLNLPIVGGRKFRDKHKGKDLS